MINPIKPMLLSRSDVPFDNEDYLFEFKFDGVRMVGYRFDDTKLFNRKLNERTRQYPEIVSELEKMPFGTVIDGEIIGVNAVGRQDFYGLLKRDLAASYAKNARVEVFFIAFDILYYDAEDVTDCPLEERKLMLESLFDENSSLIRPIDCFRGKGRLMFELAEREGLEGIVAKKLGTRYEKGKRSLSWIKIKTNILHR